MYDMSGFSYDITDVVHLLQLRVRHKNSSSMDVNCPFCGETKGKMNVNLQKNVFRCNRCDASGGMLELYGRLHGVSSAEANRQIREALGKGEYRTDYQVVHKEEPVEIFNAELADADVIDRTYQEMLSLLTLNDKHQEDLKKRGLTKEQIEIQRYRSVPLFGIKNMVQKLLESGQTVKGVPGFYEDQDGKFWDFDTDSVYGRKNTRISDTVGSGNGGTEVYLAFQCEIPKWSIIRESGTCHRKSGRRTDLFNRRCIKRYDSPLFIWRYVHLRCWCQSVQKFKASFGNAEKQASEAPI